MNFEFYFLFGGHVWMIEQALSWRDGFAVFSHPLTAIAGLGNKLQCWEEAVAEQAELVGVQIIHHLDESGIGEAVIAEQLPYMRPIFLLEVCIVVDAVEKPFFKRFSSPLLTRNVSVLVSIFVRGFFAASATQFHRMRRRSKSGFDALFLVAATAHIRDAPVFRCCVPGNTTSIAHRLFLAL